MSEADDVGAPHLRFRLGSGLHDGDDSPAIFANLLIGNPVEEVGYRDATRLGLQFGHAFLLTGNLSIEGFPSGQISRTIYRCLFLVADSDHRHEVVEDAAEFGVGSRSDDVFRKWRDEVAEFGP